MRNPFLSYRGPQYPHLNHHPDPPHGRHTPRHKNHDGDIINDMVWHLEELRPMGATEADLQEVVDTFSHLLKSRTGIDPEPDGMRGRPSHERVVMLSQFYREKVYKWLEGFTGKTFLVAGQFPPHLIEDLLLKYVQVVQIHPPTHEGETPPHFRVLAHKGLKGISQLTDLASTQCDAILFHSMVSGTNLVVSTLVPVIMRLYPDVPRYVLEADQRTPHMVTEMPDQCINRIPILP